MNDHGLFLPILALLVGIGILALSVAALAATQSRMDIYDRLDALETTVAEKQQP